MNGARRYLGRILGSRRPVLAALALAFVATFASAPAASANEPLEDTGDLNTFIAAGLPDWQFARADNNDACWPSSAFVNGDQQAPSAGLNAWPDSDSGCAPTGSPFPTYASVKACFGTEVRASYTLFFPKDGFVGLGHAYDFEHVVVGWTYAGDNKWTRYQLMDSAHGKHRVQRDWSKVESVDFNGDWGYGRERPSTYVGWGKHSMFNNQGGLKDLLSQTTDNEYRHADHAGDNTSVVIVTDDSPLAAKFNEYNWGDATDNPARVSRDLCSY